MADMQKNEGQFSDAENDTSVSAPQKIESLSELQKLLIEDNSQDNYDYRNYTNDYEDDSSYYESDNLDGNNILISRFIFFVNILISRNFLFTYHHQKV